MVFFFHVVSAHLQEVSWKLHCSLGSFGSWSASECLSSATECVLKGGDTKLCCECNLSIRIQSALGKRVLALLQA